MERLFAVEPSKIVEAPVTEVTTFATLLTGALLTGARWHIHTQVNSIESMVRINSGVYLIV